MDVRRRRRADAPPSNEIEELPAESQSGKGDEKGAVGALGDSQKASLFMFLLALQYGLQPILTRRFLR